jgi:chromosome segregation ATPase
MRKIITANVKDSALKGGVVNSQIDTIEQQLESLTGEISLTKTIFQNGMHSLKEHLDSHEALQKHFVEFEDRIEAYVVQQLKNTQILQLYIEKELLLSDMSNTRVEKQVETLALTPFWKKTTRKQRERILLRVQNEVQKKYAPKINDLEKQMRLHHQTNNKEEK